MEGAPKSNNNEPQTPNQWESLTKQRSVAEQQFQDDLLNIEDMQKSGRISPEQAAQFRAEVTARVEKARNPELSTENKQWLEDELANIEDMLRHGRIDQTKADQYIAEVKDRAIEKEDELRKAQSRGNSEGEEQKPETGEREEEEERLKKEEEERLKQEEEKRKQLEEDEEKIRQLKKRREEIDKELSPLAAINADFTHDKKELAHDIAEQQLNEEQEKANLVKRIWKGNLFKKYYQKKYERELLSGERTAGLGEDGKEITLDDIIKDRSGSAIQRFVMGATEDMGYIHQKIGKGDGEKLTEADAETTAVVRSAIEKFASAKIPEGGSMEDLKREFRNNIKRIKAEARDQGREINSTMIDNYFEVAIQARQRIEHGIAMEKVMEGFKVYNADVRNNMRTEAHRDNIDKIVNKIESSKLGSIIPAEVLAVAVSSAWSLTQTGARSLAKVAVPVGGIAVSGALAGLRERNRVTEDRARMMRDAAVGLEYDGTSGEDVEGHRAKKRAKYEAKIGGTLYDLRPAKELTANIVKAIESGDNEAKLRAIAEARVRIGYSDSEQKDLIAYSSADKMGDERLGLDIAVIRAEKSLSDEDKQRLNTMKATIYKEINGDVDKNDAEFRKVRRVQALKQAGKTMAIGTTVFFASQEIMAVIDPNKVGLLEKAGIIKSNGNETQETALASLLHTTHQEGPIDVRGDNQVAMDQYEKNGFTKIEKTPGWPKTEKELVDIDPSKSTAQVRVAYDGWANNGTNVSDGNELRLYLNNGQISSGMYGTSTMGGQVLDYDAAAATGRIKGYLTIGDAKFEIASKVNPAGQLTWGDNGVFTTTTGETIKAIGDNGEKLYKYFEIAFDNGQDADGISHIIPAATDVGLDSFSGKMQQVTEKIVEQPAIYSFIKTTTTEYPGGVTGSGIFAGPASRVSLGGPRANNNGGGGPTIIVDTTGNLPPRMIEGQEAQEIIDNGNTTGTENTGITTPPVPASPTVENGPAPQNQPTEAQPGTEQPEIPQPETEQAERAEFTDRIRRDFGNLVGEEGVRIMTLNTNSIEDNNNIATWWTSLSQEAKDAVIGFERENHPYGKALRNYLQVNGLIERG